MAECNAERIIKIGPYLLKLSQKDCVGVLLYYVHVCIYKWYIFKDFFVMQNVQSTFSFYKLINNSICKHTSIWCKTDGKCKASLADGRFAGFFSTILQNCIQNKRYFLNRLQQQTLQCQTPEYGFKFNLVATDEFLVNFINVRLVWEGYF